MSRSGRLEETHRALHAWIAGFRVPCLVSKHSSRPTAASGQCELVAPLRQEAIILLHSHCSISQEQGCQGSLVFRNRETGSD